MDPKRTAAQPPPLDDPPESRSSDGSPVIDRSSQESAAPLHGYVNRGAGGYASTDEALQQAVLEALLQHPELSASVVGVRVQRAVATLEGCVPSTEARKRAVRKAEGVPGIRRVRDRLSVQSTAPKA